MSSVRPIAHAVEDPLRPPTDASPCQDNRFFDSLRRFAAHARALLSPPTWLRRTAYFIFILFQIVGIAVFVIPATHFWAVRLGIALPDICRPTPYSSPVLEEPAIPTEEARYVVP